MSVNNLSIKKLIQNNKLKIDYSDSNTARRDGACPVFTKAMEQFNNEAMKKVKREK